MSYEKLIMYMASTPDYEEEDDSSNDDRHSKANQSKEETKVVNLFDYARGNY